MVTHLAVQPFVLSVLTVRQPATAMESSKSSLLLTASIWNVYILGTIRIPFVSIRKTRTYASDWCPVYEIWTKLKLQQAMRLSPSNAPQDLLSRLIFSYSTV